MTHGGRPEEGRNLSSRDKIFYLQFQILENLSLSWSCPLLYFSKLHKSHPVFKRSTSGPKRSTSGLLPVGENKAYNGRIRN